MIFCSLVIVGVLSKRRGRTLRTPTTPRPASASASAMTPIVRLSLNYCRIGSAGPDVVRRSVAPIRAARLTAQTLPRASGSIRFPAHHLLVTLDSFAARLLLSQAANPTDARYAGISR